MATNSCCPSCKLVLPATKSNEGNNVYLTKTCPEHGTFKVLISKDGQRFFDKTYCVPGKEVYEHQTLHQNGCPADCGLCPEHKQHLCTALIEITDKCNLHCPVCYFGNQGKTDISVGEFRDRLATIMRTENGKLEVLQISGGEPTLHNQFSEILEYAAAQNINRVLVNTNGLSLHSDSTAYQTLKVFRDKIELYLQFDGFDKNTNLILRGKDLLEEKLRIIEQLDRDDITMCLAVTVIPENLSEIKPILDLAIRTKNITGITLQRFTKTGSGERIDQKSVLQEDILQGLSDSGYLQYKHIVPLPCSHENCTSLSFLFIVNGKTYSLGEFIDFAQHKSMLQNKIGFDSTLLDYINEQLSSTSQGCCSWITQQHPVVQKLKEFTEGKASHYKDMKILRIIVKNFMDAYTFDSERAEKCCVGVSVGGNRIIPFCVNNIFNMRQYVHAC